MRHSKVLIVALIAGLILATLVTTALAIQAMHTVPTYAVNAAGQTYGSAAHAMSPDEYPELIAAVGVGGVRGYVYREHFDGQTPKTPEEALAIQVQIDMRMAKAAPGTPVIIDEIPLYAADGTTVIGTFQVINVVRGATK